MQVLPFEPRLRCVLARWSLPVGLESDDIVQEVYGRLAETESIAGIRDIPAYMIGIARTIVLMHIRRSRIVSIRTVEDIARFDTASEEPSPEEQVAGRQQLDLLALALGQIKEPGRSAFVMRVVQGLTHGEIGHRLGMSENAVQKSNARVLRNLARQLGSVDNAPPETSSRWTSWDDGPDEAKRHQRRY